MIAPDTVKSLLPLSIVALRIIGIILTILAPSNFYSADRKREREIEGVREGEAES